MTDTPSKANPTAKTRTAANAAKVARDAALNTAEKTAQVIEGNPMSVLVGGLAVGVIAGALIRRSEREAELMRPVGARLRDGTISAVKLARDAGAAELAAAGISLEAGRAQVTKLIDAVSQAATRAGEVVTKPAKDK